MRMPARSPGLSSTGPEVTLKPTPSSLATMFDSVVFPSPGGPWSRVWSRASPRRRAACTNTRRLDMIFSWPLKSSNASGRSAFSISFSVSRGSCPRISKSSSSMSQNYKILAKVCQLLHIHIFLSAILHLNPFFYANFARLCRGIRFRGLSGRRQYHPRFSPGAISTS